MAVLDDFNRSDGAPGANWAQAISAYSLPNIVSNALDYPQFPSGYWTTQFAADQWVSLKRNVAGNVQVILRLTSPNSGSESYIRVQADMLGGNGTEAYKVVAGTTTSLGFESGVMQATDAYLKVEVSGTTINSYASTDGASWSFRKTWDTGGAVSGAGYIGFYNPNNTNAGSIDDFGGGNIATPPAAYVTIR